MIQAVRGFRDILPGDVPLWQYVERTAVDLFTRFGFREIRPPILEKTELFARSIGESTDIVEKEMYTFPDRKGDPITMRPEATASVVRAYIQHSMYAQNPVQKLYTIGPMFRRERPQRGRYRQFYQINAEVFGVAAPQVDAQLILMLVELLTRLSVTDASVHINSLGCPECRPAFRSALVAFLGGRTDALCSDCNRRTASNPLRVLDCKVPTCREAMKGAPALKDHLCGQCSRHFSAVTTILGRFEIDYRIDDRLVRGLDYYTRTTFEIQTSALGAQSAVCGGGRYDGLVEALGGPDTPGIGFAIGLDRLVDIVGLSRDRLEPSPKVFIAALGEKAVDQSFDWMTRLCRNGIPAEMDFNGRSLKSQMKLANRLKARHVLIVGEDELSKGACLLRNMATKEQEAIPTDRLVEDLTSRLKGV
ncbi:MAG: histidine--tRNA ligase [Desulfobacterales bacterium]|jgi:histidyl-tRNA synthetase